MSQLGSTAIDRTRRRAAVRSSGSSEKMSPGLEATYRTGRYRSNSASATGCDTSRSETLHLVAGSTIDGANARASVRLVRIHRIVPFAMASLRRMRTDSVTADAR